MKLIPCNTGTFLFNSTKYIVNNNVNSDFVAIMYFENDHISFVKLVEEKELEKELEELEKELRKFKKQLKEGGEEEGIMEEWTRRIEEMEKRGELDLRSKNNNDSAYKYIKLVGIIFYSKGYPMGDIPGQGTFYLERNYVCYYKKEIKLD